MQSDESLFGAWGKATAAKRYLYIIGVYVSAGTIIFRRLNLRIFKKMHRVPPSMALDSESLQSQYGVLYLATPLELLVRFTTANIVLKIDIIRMQPWNRCRLIANGSVKRYNISL